MSGDFSDLLHPLKDQVANQLVDPATGFDYPNNQIPRAQFNPNGFGLAARYPAPNIKSAADDPELLVSSPMSFPTFKG